MKKANFLYKKIITLVTLIIISCNKNNCITSYGNTITIKKELKYFSKLQVFDNIQVNIIPDSTHFIEITFGDKLIDKIETTIKDSTLILKNNNKCNWLRRFDKYPIVNLHLPNIREITSYSNKPVIFTDTLNLPYFPPNENPPDFHLITNVLNSGDVYLLLKCPPCQIKNTINSTGNLTLKGNIGIVYTSMNYSGFYYAGEAITAYNFISNAGISDAYITVSKGLQVIIRNSGNVYIKGKARFYEEIIKLGTGNVYRIP